MTFLIPMAGKSQRFFDAGYKTPKMLIKVHKKFLFQWSIDSLPLDLCKNLVIVLLKEDEDNFNISELITEQYKNDVDKIYYVYLDEVTRGQAETVFKAKHCVDLNEPLVVFNTDTYFNSSTIKDNLLRNDIDGVLGSFASDSKNFSFAKIGSDGLINETAEKIVISKNALTGLYHFKNPNDFFEACTFFIEKNILNSGEFYIALMYNKLIQEGKKYIIDSVSDHWILGTPKELEYFRDNFKVL